MINTTGTSKQFRFVSVGLHIISISGLQVYVENRSMGTTSISGLQVYVDYKYKWTTSISGLQV